MAKRRRRKTPRAEYRWIAANRGGWRGWVWSVELDRRVWLPVRATPEEAFADAKAARGPKADPKRRPVGRDHLRTLSDGCALVRASLERRERRRGTREWYEDHLAPWLAAWGPGRLLAAITPADVEAVARERRERVSASTVAADLRALNRVFRLAIREGGRQIANPLEQVERPTVELPPVYPLERSEVMAAVLALERPDADVALFLFAFGVRRTELAELDVDAIDLGGGTLTVRHGKRRPRVLPVPAEAYELLTRFKVDAMQRKSRWLVPGVTGMQRARGIDKAFYRMQRKLAAMPAFAAVAPRFRAHNLRHSLGAHLARHGVPESQIGAILGHQRGRETMTARYTQAHGPDLRRALGLVWREDAEPPTLRP